MKSKLSITEKQLKDLIVEYLNRKGHFVWVQNSGMASVSDKYGKVRMWRAGIKGCSDILGIANDKYGSFIAVECKVGRNKPTEEQKQFLKEIQKRKGYAIVAYNLEDIEKIL